MSSQTLDDSKVSKSTPCIIGRSARQQVEEQNLNRYVDVAAKGTSSHTQSRDLSSKTMFSLTPSGVVGPTISNHADASDATSKELNILKNPNNTEKSLSNPGMNCSVNPQPQQKQQKIGQPNAVGTHDMRTNLIQPSFQV